MTNYTATTEFIKESPSSESIVKELMNICNECLANGIIIETVQESHCKFCPNCGWSACSI